MDNMSNSNMNDTSAVNNMTDNGFFSFIRTFLHCSDETEDLLKVTKQAIATWNEFTPETRQCYLEDGNFDDNTMSDACGAKRACPPACPPPPQCCPPPCPPSRPKGPKCSSKCPAPRQCPRPSKSAKCPTVCPPPPPKPCCPRPPPPCPNTCRISGGSGQPEAVGFMPPYSKAGMSDACGAKRACPPACPPPPRCCPPPCPPPKPKGPKCSSKCPAPRQCPRPSKSAKCPTVCPPPPPKPSCPRPPPPCPVNTCNLSDGEGSYLKFVRAYRNKHADFKPEELVKQAARAWCLMPEEKKNLFRSKNED